MLDIHTESACMAVKCYATKNSADTITSILFANFRRQMDEELAEMIQEQIFTESTRQERERKEWEERDKVIATYYTTSRSAQLRLRSLGRYEIKQL